MRNVRCGKKNGAEDIMVVVPYLAYSRQDRKDQSGASITARLVADILQTAGANRIVTCDLHAEQETGFIISLLTIYTQV